MLRNKVPTESFGWWRVSTEGDVEGRTMKDLGIFLGHVDEIAFSLADQCEYVLFFTPIPDPTEVSLKTQAVREVTVRIDGLMQGGYRKLDKVLEDARHMFRGRDVEVTAPNGSTFVLTRNLNAEQLAEIRRQRLTDKLLRTLSEEEQEALKEHFKSQN